MSLDQTEACFIAAERHGVAALARLPVADPFLARRLLDAGAAGLLVPVVESADEFADFAEHCSYKDRRGAGLSRCNAYGDDFEAYYHNFRPLLIPQVETLKGVEAAASLAAMAEIDGIFLGPYDLSADLGTPGDFTTKAFKEAALKVRQACEKNRKALGIHQVEPNAVELKERVAEGYLMIAYATDIIAMRNALGRPSDIID
jgi:2-keto-3-deoxy-L-rhamnonate aldolase RhmA